ncbi:MAG TPA: glycosyltransferase family 4 protein, partial [Acidimicrobiales bacterium]|nr:glycosyltransferase family 4 protein [Acidimicrobiales bacterium]
RQELPSAQVRLVGEPGPAGRGLHRPPHVVVVGRVASMEAELAAADLVAVPLRWGSGTRVKILEAFAHRIPVVSTSLGAEGIEGAEDGRHLLVADSPEAFASACVRLLGDLALRRRLVQAAEALFLERFEWVRVAEAVRQLALDTVGEPARLG